MNLRSVLLAGLVVGGAIVVGVFGLQGERAPPARVTLPEPAPPSAAPVPPAEPAASAAATTVPVVEPESEVTEQALRELLTSKPAILDARALVQLDDLPHRVAATVDGLARDHAPVRVWPLSPAAGRFQVARADGRTSISADNAGRYTPYVVLLEKLPVPELLGILKHFQPLFDQAWRELGYPGGAFNDRLRVVIDQLLATPEPAALPGVHLPAMQSTTPPPRPWVLYEFDDPALERLSAGQKILVRMGPANAGRVKAVLRELRAGLGGAAPG